MDTADKVRAIPISKLSSLLFLLVKRGEREKGAGEEASPIWDTGWRERPKEMPARQISTRPTLLRVFKMYLQRILTPREHAPSSQRSRNDSARDRPEVVRPSNIMVMGVA
jgi:hypothetical protein